MLTTVFHIVPEAEKNQNKWNEMRTIIGILIQSNYQIINIPFQKFISISILTRRIKKKLKTV